MTHLTITDITNKNDEPRIEDLRLARLLGFGKTYNLRKLIQRHEEGLEKFGKLVFSTVEKTAVTKGGRLGKGYWLNVTTQDYLKALSSDIGIPISELVRPLISVKGLSPDFGEKS